MTKNEPQNSNGTSHNMFNSRNTNQILMGVVLFIIILWMGFILTKISNILGLYWITGIAFGFILQRSRFCFTSSIRDPYLIGTASLTKAVLIALAITTIGFTAIKYGAFIRGDLIPGEEYVRPITLSTALGGILFGIGMVISSGCASGTLMRIGEGFHIQIVTLVFFLLGSLWGIHDLGWWSKIFVFSAEGIFLPDKLGWNGALMIQLLLIAFLYILADHWEEIKMNEEE
ncbi:MAG: YeeE/YedE thiosulfate transporter family protein [Eubacteriales bacterium]